MGLGLLGSLYPEEVAKSLVDQHLAQEPMCLTLWIRMLKLEMKMLETVLQRATRQAQVKVDEVAKLMDENVQLKIANED